MASPLRRWTLLGITVFFLVSLVAQYTPVSAVYDANGEQLQAGRAKKDEYYYYDKDTIVADGGVYKEKVVFKKLPLQQYAPDGEGVSSIYTPDGDTFAIANIEGDLSPDCLAVPTKKWDPDPEKSNKEPGFFLKVRDQGVVELDWNDGDAEQGLVQWKERRDASVDRSVNQPKTGAFTGAYIPRFSTIAQGVTDFPLQDPACQYNFYSFFNRLIGKYDDNTLNPGPIRAKIMGRDGMAYADYVKKTDNRLRWLAYRNSIIDATTTECEDKEDPFKCTNDVYDEARVCYGKAIKFEDFSEKTGSGGAVVVAGGTQVSKYSFRYAGIDVPDISTPDIWDNEFDSAKFVECMENSSKLVPEYFDKKEEAKEFAQSIVDTVILPVSLQPRDPEKVEDKEKADGDTRCSLGMMGWILCPVFSFMSQITDKVFELLKNWLTLAPFQPNSSSSGSMAYDVWLKLRNLANVFFIVFFMIIIYSQLTGRGIQTYGFRALLPRIIVGVLLINMSYIICGIAVDLSNIAGDSLFRILTGANIAAAETQFGTWEEVTATVVLGGGAAAGTVALIANLAAFVPIILMSFIALVTTFLVLMFRQALIIIFVMIAPIAFALYVLPNTSAWFTKWRKNFVILLMLYPIFSLVFGASQMAAEVVRGSAAESGETILAIFSLGIQVIPLFLIPLIMKFGGGAIGSFAQMIHRNTQKGPVAGLRKGAEEFRDNSKLRQQTRALNGRGIPGYSSLIRRGQRRKVKHLYHKSNAHRAAHHLAAHDQAAVIRSLRGLFGSALDKQILDYLGSESSKQKIEEFEASVALIDHADEPISGDELRDMAFAKGDHKNIDETSQAAAMRKLVNNGEITDINALLAMANRENGQMTDFQREMLVQSIKSSGIASQAAHLNNANLEAVRSGSIAAGTAGVDSLYAAAAAQGYYSADGLSSQAAGSLNGLHEAIERGAIDQAGVSAIRTNFQTAASTDKLRNRMSEGSYQAGRKL